MCAVKSYTLKTTPLISKMHRKIRFFAKLSLIVTFCILPLVAKAENYVIEMLVFAQKNAPNASQSAGFDSSTLQNKHAQIEQLLNQNTQRYQGSGLSFLASAQQALQGANYPILFTQQWRIQDLAVGQKVIATFSSDHSRIDGAITLSGQGALKSDLLVRYRPAGNIASNTDPAYFITQQQFLGVNNSYYFDNEKFAIIVGVWPDRS